MTYADGTIAWISTKQPYLDRTIGYCKNGHWWTDVDVSEDGLSGIVHEDADVTVHEIIHKP